MKQARQQKDCMVSYAILEKEELEWQISEYLFLRAGGRKETLHNKCENFEVMRNDHNSGG